MNGINNTENVHYWDNTQGRICVSLENTKKFMVFETIDDAINFLFLNGYKATARQMNAFKKETKL